MFILNTSLVSCSLSSQPIAAGECGSSLANITEDSIGVQVTWYKDILPMMLSRSVGQNYQCASCHTYHKEPDLVLQDMNAILRTLRGQGLALMPRTGDRWPEHKVQQLEAWSKNPVLGEPEDFKEIKSNVVPDTTLNILQDFNPGNSRETERRDDC